MWDNRQIADEAEDADDWAEGILSDLGENDRWN